MTNQIQKANNSITNNSVKKKFSEFIKSDSVKALIASTVGKKADRFCTAIVSAVSNNQDLSKCDNVSILSASLIGEGISLSPSPQLGHYYIIPFANKAKFVMGYKGYIQLALRTGVYSKIVSIPVKQGEFVSFDPYTEDIKLSPFKEDPDVREALPTVGYYTMIEYISGFKKALYWSKEKMEKHAITYAKGYKDKKGYTFWEKDFDAMAQKTMIRQILSKWGLLSDELRIAMESDDAAVNDDGTLEYADLTNTEEVEEQSANESSEDPFSAVIDGDQK